MLRLANMIITREMTMVTKSRMMLMRGAVVEGEEERARPIRDRTMYSAPVQYPSPYDVS